MATPSAPHKKTLRLDQGVHFYHVINCVDAAGDPYDLTGATARATIAAEEGDDTFLLDLTVANSRIVITPASGKIELIVSDEDTDALNLNDERQSWWHRVWLAESGGFVRLLQYGPVKAYPA